MNLIESKLAGNKEDKGKTPHSINKRNLLKRQLVKESKLVSKESVAILHEFERY